jgi:molybdenum-dependent DNA-binding transcriptional regulator ModE
MLTREERALATNIGDRLLELYAERDEAVTAGDLVRVHNLQAEIEEASEQRQEILARRRALEPA